MVAESGFFHVLLFTRMQSNLFQAQEKKIQTTRAFLLTALKLFQPTPKPTRPLSRGLPGLHTMPFRLHPHFLLPSRLMHQLTLTPPELPSIHWHLLFVPKLIPRNSYFTGISLSECLWQKHVLHLLLLQSPMKNGVKHYAPCQEKT